MQERHINTEQYIAEQILTTEKYVLPYINNVLPISEKITVAEIGCGQGGNLTPFLEKGCKVIGIDISKSKIEKEKLQASSFELDANYKVGEFVTVKISKAVPFKLYG